MANPPTINQIEAAAKRAESAIFALQRQLQAEVRQVRRLAFLADRPLTPEERQRVADIGTAQDELTEALRRLTFVTLQHLDNSAEVRQLQSSMDQINIRLTDDLDKLKRLEAFSATAAKVADTVAQVAAKLAMLAAGAAL